MKRFSIDANNAVTVLPAREPAVPGSTVFQTEPELLAASATWTSARLLAIWNKLPGAEPVRKFRSRAAAAARIWQQLQTLPTSAPHLTRKAREKSAAKQTAAVSTSSTGADVPASKKDQVLAMLRAAQGATLTEMMEETGWQKHTVRGFLSGAVHKKMGLKVVSTKNSAGDRVYRVKR